MSAIINAFNAPAKRGARVEPIWPRADPVALAAFDPATKYCDHRCGRSINDPRSDKERLYLCDLCGPEGKRA